MAMRLAFATSALCLGALGLGLLALADQPVTPQPPASTAPAAASSTPGSPADQPAQFWAARRSRAGLENPSQRLTRHLTPHRSRTACQGRLDSCRCLKF